jgi:phosphate transport system ATP-binding protein
MAFLDSNSNSFRAIVGVGTAVRWLSGSVGDRGNEGVAATVKQTPNSIGCVEFSYGETRALHGINLAFPARTVTALIGPSGCGKSTLLRCINRICSLYPGQRATGEIRSNGINVIDEKTDVEAQRTRIGMVFQKPTPFPMSIYDGVACSAELMGGLTRK